MNLPYNVERVITSNKDICKKIAEHIHNQRSIFCLGKGLGEPVAKEIALKIKEVTYIHAEAYNAGSFKHGPIAMIDEKERTPVIIIVVKDNSFDDMNSNFAQVKSRGASVILITNCKSDLELDGVDFVIEIPNSGLMSSFYGAFIGQLIAYYTGVKKGRNVDKPRNLAKQVVVK